MADLFSKDYLKKLLASDSVSDAARATAEASFEVLLDKAFSAKEEEAESDPAESAEADGEAVSTPSARNDLFSSDYLKTLLESDRIIDTVGDHMDWSPQFEQGVKEVLENDVVSDAVHQALEQTGFDASASVTEAVPLPTPPVVETITPKVEKPSGATSSKPSSFIKGLGIRKTIFLICLAIAALAWLGNVTVSCSTDRAVERIIASPDDPYMNNSRPK